MGEVNKKILFITTQLPYPPISGGVIKSWKMVKHLSEKYNLYAAFFLKGKDREKFSEFLSLVNLKGHYVEDLDIPRNIKTLLFSLLQFIPLNLFRNQSATFKKHIDTVASEYDIILIDHYEMFQYVPIGFKGKVVLHQHNCEYLMWKRFGEIEKNIFKKGALYIQSFLIKKYESEIGKKSDAILAAPNDIEELEKLGIPKEKFFITYHLAEDDFLTYPPLNYSPHKEALLFVGTLTWEANVDGLIWFLNNCWESLLQEKPNLQLYIVGKNPDTRIVEYANKYQNISLPGFVEDLEPYFQKSGVFICPLRFGSGIKVKVVNAMYRGIPVVTTPIGIEGLAVENNKHIAYASEPEALTQSILNLLNDENQWSSIALNSRSFAKEHLSWEFVYLTMDNAINS